MSTTAPPDVSGVHKKVEIWTKRNNSRIDSNKIQNWPIYPTVIFSQSTSRPCDPWQSLRWRPIRESRKGWETINYGSIICCRFQLKSKHFIWIQMKDSTISTFEENSDRLLVHKIYTVIFDRNKFCILTLETNANWFQKEFGLLGHFWYSSEIQNQ